jgi:CPA2 family monovalent cation:H+ antiporter-2
LSQTLGLSIALGAFLAGIMMSESIYAHQALHDVAPLRDIFSVVFFVSVGMLLDPTFIAGNLPTVSLFVTALVSGKALIGAGSALLATSNLRSAILVGVGLSQIGEFSFVLLTLGHRYHLINQSIYNLFFAGAIVSMIASPGLMSIVPKLMRRQFRNSPETAPSPEQNLLQGHVVVCGFGRIGRNLGHVLEAFDLPFIVIELNANIIEDLAMRGIKHIYGDAMNEIVLTKTNLKDAGMLVLTMPDPLSAEAVAGFARALNPNIKIVARAHRTDDIRLFRAAGVNAVVQPEFEASIEITRLVLHGLNRPISEVQHALSVIKTKRYALFQTGDESDENRPITHLDLNDDQMGIWFTVASNSLDGKSIADLDVRGVTGATITAVRRKDRSVAFPEPLFELKHNDRVYAVGNFEQLRQLEGRFALVQAN